MKRFQATVDDLPPFEVLAISSFAAWEHLISEFPEATRIVVKPFGKLRAL